MAYNDCAKCRHKRHSRNFYSSDTIWKTARVGARKKKSKFKSNRLSTIVAHIYARNGSVVAAWHLSTFQFKNDLSLFLSRSLPPPRVILEILNMWKSNIFPSTRHLNIRVITWLLPSISTKRVGVGVKCKLICVARKLC